MGGSEILKFVHAYVPNEWLLNYKKTPVFHALKQVNDVHGIVVLAVTTTICGQFLYQLYHVHAVYAGKHMDGKLNGPLLLEAVLV